MVTDAPRDDPRERRAPAGNAAWWWNALVLLALFAWGAWAVVRSTEIARPAPDPPAESRPGPPGSVLDVMTPPGYTGPPTGATRSVPRANTDPPR